MEVHNPGGVTATFAVDLLVREVDNTSPQTRTFMLGPQQSVRYADVLSSMFGFDGAAALRVRVMSGTVVVTSRTYNSVGENLWSLPVGASFGQFVPGFSEELAAGYGEEGRLFQLTQQAAETYDGFRANIGFVNTTGTAIAVRVDVYRADGTWLGKYDGSDTALPPYGFRQLNEVFKPWGSVPDGYAVVRTTTPGGRLFAFATVIDNHVTGDPIFIPQVKMTSSGTVPTTTPTTTPPATATPTRTPTATPTSGGNLPDLVPYRPLASEGQPQDWAGPIVPDYQPGTYTTSLLSSYMTTYVKWAVANLGTADVTGTVWFELQVDGQRFFRWHSDTGLKAGYYLTVEDFPIPHDTFPPGFHTLAIIADPDKVIAESNETNNSWSKSWEWTSIVFSLSPGPRPPLALGGGSVPREARIDGSPLPVAGGAGSAGLAGGGRIPGVEEAVLTAAVPVWIPASAHASGANGANWRTDVEVHNAGATAATFTVEMLKQNMDNASGVPSETFSLGPQQSVRYVDVLSSMFAFTGAASLRLTATAGSMLANSRTYNLVGANDLGLPVGASFGQFVPGLLETEAIGYGEEGRLIQLTQRTSSSYADFRTNVGFVNVTGSPIDVRVDLFDAAGRYMGIVQDDRTHLRAHEFRQVNEIFGGATSWLEDGYAVLRTTTPGGKFFAFATVIDNHVTGDPIFISAVRMAGTTPPPAPTPTPTPTPTPMPTPPPGGVPVTTSTSGSTVTVTQAGTLKDLGFTFPGAPPAGFAVWSVASSQAPAIPAEVTRLSDFFQASPVVASGGMVTLTLPVAALPAGRPAQDLRLYTYTEPACDLPEGTSISGPDWLRTWYDLNVLANGKTTIKLQGLGDLSFIGIEAPVVPVASSAGTVQVKTRRGTLAVTVSCVPKVLLIGVGDGNQQACIVGYAAGKSFLVMVKNFGDLHLTPAATMPELVGWLGAARLAFDGYGLSSDAAFEVEVGSMPAKDPTAYGFVTTRNHEDRRVLHITKAPEPKTGIQGTAVHEYFHHAQSRTKEAGKTNLIDTDHAGDWLIEGLARWFEDDLFDSLNTYVLKEHQPLRRILEVGLGTAPDEAHEIRTRGYSRFAFWKMVQSKCSGFSIPQLLNVNVEPDPRGVANFAARIESNVWQCDFGGGLGDANRAALENALLYYAFATVKNDDISLLDSDEPSFNFQTVDGLAHIAPSPDCTPGAPCAGSIVTGTIPPASAVAFVVDGVLSPPEGMISTFWLSTPQGGSAILWAGDAEQLMASPSAGKWADSAYGGAVAYGEAGQAPKALAVILNPMTDKAVTVSVRAGYPGIAVTVSPASVTLAPGGTQAFTVTVTGTSNTAVTWSIQEGAAGGTITSGGVYKAPSTPGTYHVIAQSQADLNKSGVATVTVSSCLPEAKYLASGTQNSWNGWDKIDYSVQGLAISDFTTPGGNSDLGGYPTGSVVTVNFTVYGPWSIGGSWATGADVSVNGQLVESVRAPDGAYEPTWSQVMKPVTITITDEIRRNGFVVVAHVGHSNANTADDIFVTVRGKGCQ